MIEQRLDDPQGDIGAHEASIWDLDWHPVGHILCSGSNDHTTKFWCRNRPQDKTKDRYNVQNKTAHLMEAQDELMEKSMRDTAPIIPGVGGVSSSELRLPPPEEQHRPRPRDIPMKHPRFHHPNPHGPGLLPHPRNPNRTPFRSNHPPSYH